MKEFSFVANQEQINQALKEIGADYQVKTHLVHKDNHTIPAYIVNHPGSGISPIIYQGKDWDEKTTEEIAEEINNILDYNKDEEDDLWQKVNEIMKQKTLFFQSIVLEVIRDTEENLNTCLADGIAYVLHVDLKMIERYRVIVKEEDETIASFLVTKKMLEELEISPFDLHFNAAINTRKEARLSPMWETLKELKPEMSFEEIPKDQGMYILTNKRKMKGAACILSEVIQKNIIESLGNCYIIPSSIHEVLVLPLNELPKSTSPQELKEIIGSVNDTVVEPNEVLGENLYILNDDGLRIIA